MAKTVSFGRAEEVGLGSADLAFEPPVRIQTNLLAARERALLDALCRRMPDWITPDRLTAIGSTGAVVAAIGYVASRWGAAFLFLSSLGLVINWFGDSLDGSLARHRRIERPRYGYFLDHSVDALNALVFALGLGLTPYVSMAAALLLLGGYYLLTIQVFLLAQTDRTFPLAKARVGPTELRLLAIAFNCAIFAFGPLSVRLAGTDVSVYSALVAVEAIAFIAVFAMETYATARRLDRQEARARPIA
ncbi:MAG TPA: CDP-alcohol phosphatidyltransferase family protein [Roseiarcus sp.]|nr:CDP-alcohol phosphatidyltransferase family protein [Roseiarcus sp.]